MNDYLKVIYKEEARPYTMYPFKLCGHLFKKFGLKKDQLLLDLGCGRGEFLKGFARLGLNSEGLDSCESARELSKGHKIEICDFESQRLPYRDNHFDVVFCKSVIEHSYYPEKIFKEVHRILRPNGKFIVMTPDWESVFKTFYEDYTHRTPFTLASLKNIYAVSNFRQIKVNKFRQLPLVWKFPALGFFSTIIALIFPRSKIKAIRFSKEVMLLGYAEK